ncbi:hypothetical protein Lalb_Chr03g0036671 [Lupinus albus]|uniref:Knottin, scorpion toxin n=1 Tax=Lupinus albus TaxID=3870 RepID=A0A6A4QVR3_LUPAL|nr:hypothetical protein Lalb_Chr03g0036671 [Lupinus albus]
MALLKFVFTFMIIVLLLSHGGMAKPYCIGTCKNYPNCDAYCKSQGYKEGHCVYPSPNIPAGEVNCCCVPK